MKGIESLKKEFKVRKEVLSSIVLIWFGLLCNGQSNGVPADQSVANIRKELTRLWSNSTNTEDSKSETWRLSEWDLATLAQLEKDTQMLTFVQNKISDNEAQSLNADLGFSAGTNWQYVDQSNVFFPEEMMFYRNRLQTEVRWDILKEGLIANRKKAARILAEKPFRDAQAQEWQRKLEGYSYLKAIQNHFAEQRILVLQSQLRLLNQLEQEVEQLFYYKHITKQKLEEVKARLLACQSHLDVLIGMSEIAGYNKEVQASMSKRLPTIDLEMENLLKLSKSQIPTDSLLSRQWLGHNSWFEEIKLTAYGRYNYFDIESENADRAFLSTGISLNIPLPVNVNKRKQLDRLRIEEGIVQEKIADQNRKRELLASIARFRTMQKEMKVEALTRNLTKEKLRLCSARHSMGAEDFNPLDGLLLICDGFDDDLKQLAFQESLYRAAVDVYGAVGQGNFRNLFREENLVPQNVIREVYVWSESLVKNSPEFIQEYCNYNGHSKLIVSAKDKAMFNELANLRNVQLDVLIGKNDLIDQNVTSFLTNKINGLKTVNGIHLDVEIHVLKRWENGEKSVLSQKYVTMLSDAKKFCDAKGLELSVSIPVHYPMDLLQKIYVLCDRVYLMAYEHPDPDYVVRKCAEELNIDRNKTVLALRTEDFNSRAEMEQFADQLVQRLELNYIVYHDLESLIELDRGTMNYR